MNSSKVILALWLSATAWGQVKLAQPAPQPPVAVSAKAAPAAPKAATPKRPSAAVRAHSKPVHRAVPARHLSRGTPVATAKGDGKPGLKGHRDPFVSPVVERSRGSVPCVGTGRQCLEVGEVSLHGVVRGPNGFIAVVVNGEHTYFLHNNDPLANGQVERITKDSIVLRERYFDETGRPGTREITRKLGASRV